MGVWYATAVIADPEWAELMGDRTIPHSRLFRLATRHGLVCSDVTFRRHRTGGCACGRSPG